MRGGPEDSTLPGAAGSKGGLPGIRVWYAARMARKPQHKAKSQVRSAAKSRPKASPKANAVSKARNTARKGGAARRSAYDVHPGVAMVRTWIASLKAKTGCTLEEWLAHIEAKGPKPEQERREWLKGQGLGGGLGTVTAAELAARSMGTHPSEDTPEDYLKTAVTYVDEMYVGKEQLRPLAELIIAAARKLGGDVKVCPCKTMVPLYREHVFAQIKPASKTRIDLGFALGALVKAGEKFPARLVDTGGFAKKDRITHRVEIAKVGDIDAGVMRWLRRAYELDVKK